MRTGANPEDIRKIKFLTAEGMDPEEISMILNLKLEVVGSLVEYYSPKKTARKKSE
jgi:hypothetical protein